MFRSLRTVNGTVTLCIPQFTCLTKIHQFKVPHEEEILCSKSSTNHGQPPKTDTPLTVSSLQKPLIALAYFDITFHRATEIWV